MLAHVTSYNKVKVHVEENIAFCINWHGLTDFEIEICGIIILPKKLISIFKIWAMHFNKNTRIWFTQNKTWVWIVGQV